MAIDRATGRLIAGRYELKERLGQGGMGVVWRATDILLQRDVAVKTLQIPSALDDAGHDGLHAKVLREARAAARLNHPGVVTVFDVVEDDNQPVIIMELVDSPSLAELVRRQGPLAPVRAAAIGLEVLDALTAAHASGIIHRDVKPANIMVPEQGRVRLSDFGVAALLDDPSVTTTGAVPGSPSYMAPEQATGQARGPAADLWSLGTSLYFAVEGQPPFQKDGVIATLTSIVHDEPRPHVRAAELGPVLDSLLIKDPAQRPGSEEIRRLLADVVTRAGSPETWPAPAPVAAPAPSMAPTETQTFPVTLPAPAPPAPGPLAPPSRPAPPSPPATSRAGGDPGRRRLAVPLILAAMLAMAVIVVVVVAMAGKDNQSTSTPTATSAPTPAPAAGARRSPATSTPSTTRRPPASTSSTAPAAAPAGAPADWTGYTDPATGFSISRPSGWGVRTRGTLTDFTDPASGAYLRVDHVEPPGPSPEGAWYDYEPKFAADKPRYQRIQITPTTFKGFDAAIWEFTYGEGAGARHAVDLGFVTGRYGFALNFQTPASDWERLQPVFETFKASFEAQRS